MDDNDSLVERLNRLAQQKAQEQNAREQVRLTNQQVNEFIFAEAHNEHERFLQLLKHRIEEINPGLKGVPLFEYRANYPFVKQGNVAAFANYQQLYSNAGPIYLVISFGREPEGFYGDFGEGGPEPERYRLEPAMERDPDRIVWHGDLAPLPEGISSERLVDFVLQHLTEYYLAQ